MLTIVEGEAGELQVGAGDPEVPTLSLVTLLGYWKRN
jgi:hypothetical protein